MPDPADRKSLKPGIKMLVEYGPLVLFFIINARFGIMHGTAALVAATVVALGYAWGVTRTIPKIPAFGCAAVVLFGALTLVFNDDTFIKIKPTVVSLMIAAAIAGGMLLGRNPLKALIGENMAVAMADRAWKQLSLIWIAMFCVIAAANEWAWRTLSTDGWVSFKVFGLTGISLFFGVIIAVFISRQQRDEGELS